MNGFIMDVHEHNREKKGRKETKAKTNPKCMKGKNVHTLDQCFCLKPRCHLHRYARIYALAEQLEEFLNFMQA